MLFEKQVDNQREFILDHIYPIDHTSDDETHFRQMEANRNKLKQLLDTYEQIIRQAASVPKLVQYRKQCEMVASLTRSVQDLQDRNDTLKREAIEVIDLYDADDEDILRMVERRFGYGAAQICRERGRQVSEEGYDSSHDAQYDDGELAMAAALYAMPAGQRPPRQDSGTLYDSPKDWPWDDISWKPSPQNRMRDLEKSGALSAAEIDRIRNQPPEVRIDNRKDEEE